MKALNSPHGVKERKRFLGSRRADGSEILKLKYVWTFLIICCLTRLKGSIPKEPSIPLQSFCSFTSVFQLLLLIVLFTTLKSNLEIYWVDFSFQHEIHVDVSFNDLRLFYLKESVCLFMSLFVWLLVVFFCLLATFSISFFFPSFFCFVKLLLCCVICLTFCCFPYLLPSGFTSVLRHLFATILFYLFDMLFISYFVAQFLSEFVVLLFDTFFVCLLFCHFVCLFYLLIVVFPTQYKWKHKNLPNITLYYRFRFYI